MRHTEEKEETLKATIIVLLQFHAHYSCTSSGETSEAHGCGSITAELS